MAVAASTNYIAAQSSMLTDPDWQSWLSPADEAVTLQPGEPVFVYGAGNIGRDVISVLHESGHKVLGVLDGNTFRRELVGFPVSPPDSPKISTADRAVIPLVLGLFNSFVDVPSLRARLQDLGWRRIIDFLDFHAAHAPMLGDRFWLTDREHYLTWRTSIRAADALWAAEPSRSLYRNILRFRMTGDDSLLPAPDGRNQYFPIDLPQWSQPLRVVDCGAYNGDTLRQIRALGLPISAAALFEPDPENFRQLVAEAAVLGAAGSMAAAWPCGVAEHTGLQRFCAGRGTGSLLTPEGERMIPCVALDDALSGFDVNLVKMDIEGAEMDALLGARRLIAKCRPGLAICLYHRPEDLWKIPMLIADWNLGYEMHLRMHHFRGFELVLYAFAL